MPVFPRLCHVVASASAAALLHGCGSGSSETPAPSRPDLPKVKDADCLIEGINLDGFMTDLPGNPKGYEIIGAVGFHGGHFKDTTCCKGLQGVKALIVDAAKSHAFERVMPEIMKHPQMLAALMTCMPTPSKFDVSVEVDASKDGAKVGPGVCPAQLTGPLPAVPGYTLDYKGDMVGLSETACKSFDAMSQIEAKDKEAGDKPEQDEAYVKARTTFIEQLPDAFSTLAQITITPDTAAPPKAAGAMLQALGASTEHMASLASSLLPVSAAAIAAKSLPKEEQANFIM